MNYMYDDFDLTLALTELAALEPMDRRGIVAAMKREFTPQELQHIIVGAGAALVIHGGKETSADIDCFVNSLESLQAIASRRSLELSYSMLNGAPRLEIGGFAELFYDPETHGACTRHLLRREIEVDGVRVDSPEATVAWYEFMARRANRPKGHENLRLARAALQRHQLQK